MVLRSPTNFTSQDILSVDQFERSDIDELFRVADELKPITQRIHRCNVLQGAVLASLFFEPSTRTRLSFGTAFNLLGGSVRETTGVATSAVAKGESLEDFARVVSGYSDVIVIRHSEPGAVAKFAQTATAPVINAGDGANEHPTQALLDLYTIDKEMDSHQKGIDGLRIAVVGDLKYSRTIHSLLKLLRIYTNVTVHLVSPTEMSVPEGIVQDLKRYGHRVRMFDQLVEGIGEVDVIYCVRTQVERFASPTEALNFQGKFRLNREIYSQHCQPNTVIMHPLPRDSRTNAQELSTDLNDHPNLAIFRQSDNGLTIRMALFALLFDVVDSVARHSFKLAWHPDA